MDRVSRHEYGCARGGSGAGWQKMGMQAARDTIEAGERRFSRFQQESELSQFNRSGRVNGSMHRKR